MTIQVFRCILGAILLGAIGACDGNQQTPPAASRAEESSVATPAAGTGSTDTEQTTGDETSRAGEATGGQAEPEPPAGADQAGEPGSVPPAPTGPDMTAILEQMEHDIWWNAPVVIDTLELTEAQRTRMNRFLREQAEATMARMDQTPELMQQYREALEQRRWNDAEQLADQMAQVAQDSMAASFTLQTSVLRELTEEQFAKALENYPGVLARQWVRGRRVMGAAQISRAGRAGRGGMEERRARQMQRAPNRQRRQNPRDGGQEN